MSDFIGIVIASLVASFTSSYLTDIRWEKQAIVHECAVYNPQTSDFEWLDEVQNAKP